MFIKNLKPGQTFTMGRGTVYQCTRVVTDQGKTAITYIIPKSDIGESTFVRASLTTCERIA